MQSLNEDKLSKDIPCFIRRYYKTSISIATAIFIVSSCLYSDVIYNKLLEAKDGVLSYKKENDTSQNINIRNRRLSESESELDINHILKNDVLKIKSKLNKEPPQHILPQNMLPLDHTFTKKVTSKKALRQSSRATQALPVVSAMDRGDKIAFYAMGDVPYSSQQIDKLIKHMRELEPKKDGAKFIVHLGDATKDCRLDYFDKAARNFRRHSPLPVFIIPGDNDWKDCGTRAIRKWNDNFIDFDDRWRKGFNVRRQKGREENFAFEHEGVLFIAFTIFHKKGDNFSRTGLLEENYDWVKDNMRKYASKIDSVVLFSHKRMDTRKSDYKKIFSLLKNDYDDIPVLYIHGDGHVFRRETLAQNILDVQVDQGRRAPPLLVTVHNKRYARSRDKFDFTRRRG